MTTPALTETTDALFAATVRALSLIAFATGSKEEIDGMVRVLTDWAADANEKRPARELWRAVAMQLHDDRIRNAAWKEGLTPMPAENSTE